MEWMNRPGRPTEGSGQSPSPTSPSGAPSPQHTERNSNRQKGRTLSFHNITSVILLFSITFLALAVIGFIMNYRGKDESRYVAKDNYQAVFLTGGQVYFGKIRELNNKYVGVTDIYYLRVNQQVQPKQGEEQSQQDISLVKLGCELHGPQDQMLINRDQVTFWENLKSDGQVAKAVEAYKKANPDGQKCETNQQTTPTSNSGNQPQSQNNQPQTQNNQPQNNNNTPQ